MTSEDVDMQDAQDSPSIIPFHDEYESLLCLGLPIENPHMGVIIDEHGNPIELNPSIPGTNVLQRDSEGFEWKLEDGEFWKREVVDFDQVADEPVWVRSTPKQTVRTDLDSLDLSIPDDVRSSLIERLACDEFDKIVKHIFFDKGIRERGTMLVKTRCAQVSFG